MTIKPPFITLFVFIMTTVIGLAVFWPPSVPISPHIPHRLWNLTSIDTMKYSRDLAREKGNDPSFDAIINQQIENIAGTGATHVAIATPYEKEFVPYLTRWVMAARSHGLKVWFRGNTAGWEGWFGYPPVSREEHTALVVNFIYNNPSLFQDGDLFTPCPECENGGPGDPRKTGDVQGFRQFLISERQAVLAAFHGIGKNVSVDVQSMNYDVASLVMDPSTTQALGGVVGIDHYVKDPHQLARDVTAIASSSGGRVFLSEYGAPIPDIHGKFTEAEQAEWLQASLADLSQLDVVAGINYWVAVGGSTEIWDEKGQPTQAVRILERYYRMQK